MELLYTSKEPNYSLVRISYQDWLQIKEPVLFSFVDQPEDNNLLTLRQTDCLLAYTTMVSLLKVGDALYKLNGKNRKTAWCSGKVTPPDTLIAQIINISEDTFLSLNDEAQYTRLNSLPSNEVVKSAYQELGVIYNSERLREGFISEAINIALRGKPRVLQDKRFAAEKEDINIKKAIQLFSEELEIIDNLQPKSEIFVSGVLGGALLMLGIDKKVKTFFEKVNNYQSETKEGLEDPVGGLLRAIEAHRTSDPAIPARMAADLCRKTIQAIILWNEGTNSSKYWRKKLLSGVDPKPYIRKLKSLKQINAFRDL